MLASVKRGNQGLAVGGESVHDGKRGRFVASGDHRRARGSAIRPVVRGFWNRFTLVSGDLGSRREHPHRDGGAVCGQAQAGSRGVQHLRENARPHGPDGGGTRRDERWPLPSGARFERTGGDRELARGSLRQSAQALTRDGRSPASGVPGRASGTGRRNLPDERLQAEAKAGAGAPAHLPGLERPELYEADRGDRRRLDSFLHSFFENEGRARIPARGRRFGGQGDFGDRRGALRLHGAF